MAGSTLGTIFSVSTWGESHGKGVGVVIDGCPAGLSLCEEDVQKYLNRRKPGQSKYTTKRKEDDKVEKKLYGRHGKNLMKTDVQEHEDVYTLEMDLPGFTKDEIKVSLEDGYLTISAAKGLDKDEQDKKSGKYIRKERYAGACERSFYVGENLTEEDIKGGFKHGVLTLFIPKKEAKPAVEQKKYVTIEG